MTQALPTGFVAILSLISTNIAGYTRKTTVAAMYLIAYCIGNIIGKMNASRNATANFPKVHKRFDQKMHQDMFLLRLPSSFVLDSVYLICSSSIGIANRRTRRKQLSGQVQNTLNWKIKSKLKALGSSCANMLQMARLNWQGESGVCVHFVNDTGCVGLFWVESATTNSRFVKKTR